VWLWSTGRMLALQHSLRTPGFISSPAHLCNAPRQGRRAPPIWGHAKMLLLAWLWPWLLGNKSPNVICYISNHLYYLRTLKPQPSFSHLRKWCC
jgi:hypothetical protein